MARAWRITEGRFSDDPLSGEGARLYGGRWNPPGVAVAYTSPTLSLAALELFVHLNPSRAPSDLVAIPIDIPAKLKIEGVDPDQLPPGWREYPAPVFLQDFGSEWVGAGRTAVLRIPSAIIPVEFNLLINPAHPEFSSIRVGAPVPFAFDPRMWKGFA